MKVHQSLYAFPNAPYWKLKQTAHAETDWSSIYFVFKTNLEMEGQIFMYYKTGLMFQSHD